MPFLLSVLNDSLLDFVECPFVLTRLNSGCLKNGFVEFSVFVATALVGLSGRKILNNSCTVVGLLQERATSKFPFIF